MMLSGMSGLRLIPIIGIKISKLGTCLYRAVLLMSCAQYPEIAFAAYGLIMGSWSRGGHVKYLRHIARVWVGTLRAEMHFFYIFLQIFSTSIFQHYIII